MAMSEEVLKQQQIDFLEALQADFPDHVPGTRPVHSVGVGAIGWFRATHSAAIYCKARHFSREWIPVRVRFSNGNGQNDPDGRLQIRGLAIRFYLGGTIKDDEAGVEHPPTGEPTHTVREGGNWPIVAKSDTPIEITDLLCMSVPTFMADSLAGALEFAQAFAPQKIRRPGPIARLKSLATMCPIPPQEHGATASGVNGGLAFAGRYTQAQSFVVESSMLQLPTSYTRTVYHAVHAFELEGSDGTKRMGRFFLEPSDGVRAEGPPEPTRSPLKAALLQPTVNAHGATLADRYLAAQLAERLARGPTRFNVRVQIADPWDDTSDPTKQWNMNRQRVLMGTLRLDRLVGDQDAECEELSFNPGRLVEGIAPSDDPVFAARVGAYEESYRRRITARGKPIAASECPLARR